jgi:hypothetical protein
MTEPERPKLNLIRLARDNAEHAVHYARERVDLGRLSHFSELKQDGYAFTLQRAVAALWPWNEVDRLNRENQDLQDRLAEALAEVGRLCAELEGKA